MSRRDDSVRLRHMLDHAREAVAFVRGRSRADLNSDRMLQLAIVRLLEIIGEAATRVTREGQAKHPAIPWRETIALRNRIIHGYDTINNDIVWQIVHDDLPTLIALLELALAPHTG